MANNTKPRADLPDLVRFFREGDYSAVLRTLALDYETPAEAASQALALAAYLIEFKHADYQQLWALAKEMPANPYQKCRYCRGDETASACECV